MICPERRQPGSLTGSATKAMSLLVTDQIQWRTSAPALSLGRPGIRGLDWDRRSAARLTNATFYLYATFHSNDTSLIFNTTRSLWHTLRRIQGEIRHNSLRSAFGTYSGFSLSPAPLSARGVYQFPKGNWRFKSSRSKLSHMRNIFSTKCTNLEHPPQRQVHLKLESRLDRDSRLLH